MNLHRWMHVPGRGWVALMWSSDPERDMGSIKIGEPCRIDGHDYTVVGIEYAVGLTISHEFGIVIRGEPHAR